MGNLKFVKSGPGCCLHTVGTEIEIKSGQIFPRVAQT